MMRMTARCPGTTISRQSEGVKNMKIVCTKEEFARLIRWCERAFNEVGCCGCPFRCAESEPEGRDVLAGMCQIVETEVE